MKTLLVLVMLSTGIQYDVALTRSETVCQGLAALLNLHMERVDREERYECHPAEEAVRP